MKYHRQYCLVAAVIFTLGLVFILAASYIQIKAAMAQILIASAYKQQFTDKEAQKPWPWADTEVLAKLEIGEHINYVLKGASMRNLAFGPAHMSQTGSIGGNGNTVIVGHRDTHFAHLQDINVGQVIQLHQPGNKIKYTVTELAIINDSDLAVAEDLSTGALTLITCYPFNGVDPNPRKRFVVRAIKTV